MYHIGENCLQNTMLSLARVSWGIKDINYHEKPETAVQTYQIIPK